MIHRPIGISHEMPFTECTINSYHAAIADGSTDIHNLTVAKAALGQFEGSDALFPDYMASTLQEHAREKFGLTEMA